MGRGPSSNLAYRRQAHRDRQIRRGLPVFSEAALQHRRNPFTANELRLLINEHRSWKEVSRNTGVDYNTIIRWARKHQVASQYTVHIKVCARCGLQNSSRVKIIRFRLYVGAAGTNRRVGSIGLCRSCYEKVAVPSIAKMTFRIDWTPDDRQAISDGYKSRSLQSQGGKVGQRDRRSITGQKVA